MFRCAFCLVATICLFGGSGCGDGEDMKYFDPADAQSSGTRPVSTETAPITIAADPSLPKWVLTVAPLTVAASGATSGTGFLAPEPSQNIGRGLAAQLLSALSRVGNVVVVDYEMYQNDRQRLVANLQPGEVGPFLIQGTVTEFNETADLTGQGESSNSVAWNFVPYVGPFIAFGKGSKSKQEIRRTGMVGLDLQIIDPSTGRMIASFVSEGCFTALGATTTKTQWGKTKVTTDYAASAIGQASRLAINQAVRDVHALLRRSPTPPVAAPDLTPNNLAVRLTPGS